MDVNYAKIADGKVESVGFLPDHDMYRLLPSELKEQGYLPLRGKPQPINPLLGRLTDDIQYTILEDHVEVYRLVVLYSLEEVKTKKNKLLKTEADTALNKPFATSITLSTAVKIKNDGFNEDLPEGVSIQSSQLYVNANLDSVTSLESCIACTLQKRTYLGGNYIQTDKEEILTPTDKASALLGIPTPNLLEVYSDVRLNFRDYYNNLVNVSLKEMVTIIAELRAFIQTTMNIKWEKQNLVELAASCEEVAEI
jgi:hypothetical protein